MMRRMLMRRMIDAGWMKDAHDDAMNEEYVVVMIAHHQNPIQSNDLPQMNQLRQPVVSLRISHHHPIAPYLTSSLHHPMAY